MIFCSCGVRNDIIKTYDDPYFMPSHMTRLYPEKAEDKTLAVLLRKYDEAASAIAVCTEPEAEPAVIYRLPDGKITYEISAGDGIIAFYELTTYTDGSVNYALKVIDTKSETLDVRTPYNKSVSDENDVQTRFICVYGGCVYYITKSNLLGRCRVMKYSLKDDGLTEYIGVPFTENEITGGASVTSISVKNGYLTIAVVSGNKTTLKTYNLTTDELVREKELPYGVAMVYMADHDYNTGMYAIYYYSAQSDERVGIFAYSDSSVEDVFTLTESEYVNHEDVKIEYGAVGFVIQDTEKTAPHDQFYALSKTVSEGELKKTPGVFGTVRTGDDTYGLEFDTKKGYDAVHLIKITK